MAAGAVVGMAASKKWKYTVRIDAPDSPGLTLGLWLEQRGLGEKFARCAELAWR